MFLVKSTTAWVTSKRASVMKEDKDFFFFKSGKEWVRKINGSSSSLDREWSFQAWWRSFSGQSKREVTVQFLLAGLQKRQKCSNFWSFCAFLVIKTDKNASNYLYSEYFTIFYIPHPKIRNLSLFLKTRMKRIPANQDTVNGCQCVLPAAHVNLPSQ